MASIDIYSTEKTGLLANLTTTEQGTLVGAINEVDANCDTNASAITELNEDLTTMGSNIADIYDTTATYAVGDYVMYDDVLYVCTTAWETAGDFDTDYWAEVSAGEELVNLSHDIEYFDQGKKRLAKTFQFGTLDSSGAIATFVSDIRSVSVEYYEASSGDILFQSAGYSMILCKYDSDYTLSSRTVYSSSTSDRTYELTSGSLYRVAIWDSSASTQTNPYQYAYKIYIPTSTQTQLDELDETASRAMLALNRNQSDYTDADDIDVSVITASLTSGGMSNIPTDYGTIVTLSPKSTSGGDSTVANVQLWFPYDESDVFYYRKNYNSTWLSWETVYNADAVESLVSSALPDMSMFETMGVIGDSFASGYMGVTSVNQYTQSWGQVMARKHGMTVTNYSKDGQTARAWITTSSRGLSALLEDDALNLYIIALGLNDAYLYTQDSTYLGSESDIDDTDYDNNADTFYGNMGRIICNIQAHAPNAKIILLTTPYGTYNGNSGAVNRTADVAINDAIVAIAEHYSIPVVITLSHPLFYSSEYKNNITTYGSHPTATMYSAMANAYEYLIGNAMADYESYFADYNNS